MYFVEQHIITINDKRYKDLDRICLLSKNLYNAALYIIKQEFISTGKWIRAVELNKKMASENNIDYRSMSGSSSQQFLRFFTFLRFLLILHLISRLSRHGNVIIRNLPAALNSQNISIKQKAGTYFLILTHSLNIEEILSISLKRKDYLL